MIALLTRSNRITLFAEDIVQNIGSIGPEAEFTYSFTVTGLKLGSHDLVVGMESDKVELVTGQKEVSIYDDNLFSELAEDAQVKN